MKKIFITTLFIGIAFLANSQSLIGGKNIIKTNLSANALKNYNITFERSLNHFVSLSASYSNMDKRSLPLKGLVKQFIDNPNIDFNNFKVANNAFTLEGRFYLGLQKMSGFYIAPYARFGTLSVDVPVNYTYNVVLGGLTVPVTPSPAVLTGSIRSKSAGAYFGMQYQLLTKLVLDIWVIGGHYGTSEGTLEYKAPLLTPNIALDEIKRSVDQTNAKPFSLTTKIVQNNDGTKSIVTNSDGPWAGIRGAGITVGLRF